MAGSRGDSHRRRPGRAAIALGSRVGSLGFGDQVQAAQRRCARHQFEAISRMPETTQAAIRVLLDLVIVESHVASNFSRTCIPPAGKFV